MSTLPKQTFRNVDYPESDGKPMGETDLHRDWMFRVLEIFRQRYRKQRVYAASDLLVYYQEGLPYRFVVPDVFVVLNTKPGRRRTYKIWQEGKPPEVVVEITSKATRREDESIKPGIYQEIGVKEYFLYDPTQDYLKPPLRGFRRSESGSMVEMVAGKQRLLESLVLGITLQLDDAELVMRDVHSNEVLLTGEEHHAQRALEANKREAKAKQREAEAKQREAEARRLETEAVRLEAAARKIADVALKREAEARKAAHDAKLKQQQAEAKVADLQAELEKLRRAKKKS